MDPVLVYMDENMLIHARANSWKMFSFQANNNLWYTYNKDFSVVSYQSKQYNSLRFPKLLWKNLKISCTNLFISLGLPRIFAVGNVSCGSFFFYFFLKCAWVRMFWCVWHKHIAQMFCGFVCSRFFGRTGSSESAVWFLVMLIMIY